jgi:hypothetical protein
MATVLRVLLAVLLTGTAWTAIAAALAHPAPVTPSTSRLLVDRCSVDGASAVCRTPGPDPPARPSP